MRKISTVSLFGLTGLWAASAIAGMSEKDYYCSEALIAPVASYALHIQDCGGGKTRSEERICTESVNCVALTEEDKAQAAKGAGKKKFSDLTAKEKFQYFKGLNNLDWFPSTLTCSMITTANGEKVCPLPEACKGDFLFKVKPAPIESFDELKDRVDDHQPHVFPARPESPAGSAK